MKSSGFELQTETFQGPIELLLQLIEERKLPINDISLAQVTDEYISHIRQMDTLPVNDVARFIVVASTLVLIKSKSLLPALGLSNEEEHSIEDLERRLRLYQKIQTLADGVHKKFGTTVSYARPFVVRHQVFAPDEKNMNVENLCAVLQQIIAAIPTQQSLPKRSVKKVIRLEEMIGRLMDRMQEGMQVSFNNFARAQSTSGEQREEKIFMIVGFLAMLELVRNGMLDVVQRSNFDDITISKL